MASPALIWILDLALRLRISADNIDWEAFSAKNEAYGTSAASAVALVILKRLFSGPMPDDLGAWAEESVPTGMVRLSKRLTMADIVEERLVQHRARRLAAQFSMNPGLSAKWTFAAGSLRRQSRRVLRQTAFR